MNSFLDGPNRAERPKKRYVPDEIYEILIAETKRLGADVCRSVYGTAIVVEAEEQE